MVKFTYLAQPPKKWTFEQPKLKLWTEDWCYGKVLNLFAGQTKMDCDEFRVDISDEYNPDFVWEDAYEFIKILI